MDFLLEKFDNPLPKKRLKGRLRETLKEVRMDTKQQIK